ncbi:MAG: PorP/SprF family type IX secretion system membrane protein [Bacteroidota bacterium]
MKSLLTILLVISLLQIIHAQDAIFSQYINAPALLNPSLTGQIDNENNHRLLFNYRRQWVSVLGNSAFQTYNLAYDHRIQLKKDQIGVGGSFTGDRAGQSKFSTISSTLSAAYHKRFSENQIITGSGGIGLSQRSINIESLTWPSQHNGNGGFNLNLPGDSLTHPSVLSISVNAGLMWTFLGKNENQFNLGIGIFHLNRPDISINERSISRLNARLSVHVTYQFSVSDKLQFSPSLAYFTQGSFEMLILGTSSVYKLDEIDNYKLHFGIYPRIVRRSLDASDNNYGIASITGLLGWQYKDLMIMLSYDTYAFTTSPLSRALDNRKGIELALGWLF